MDNKKLLRKLKMIERDSLSSDELQALSDIIAKRVFELDEYKEASKILCYVSCRSEVMTEKILNRALAEGKKVGVPKVEGNRMVFYQVESLSDLTPGYFGILEPCGSEDKLMEPDESLIIVPGLVFDRQLNRIGYGKGFYDRFFAENEGKKYVKCGIAFDIQLCGKIETEAMDYALDMLVTESDVVTLG